MDLGIRRDLLKISFVVLYHTLCFLVIITYTLRLPLGGVSFDLSLVGICGCFDGDGTNPRDAHSSAHLSPHDTHPSATLALWIASLQLYSLYHLSLSVVGTYWQCFFRGQEGNVEG